MRLAKVLDSINLPHNQKVLRALTKRSEHSFTEKIVSPMSREYLFVLEDTSQRSILGTSQIIAQHGTKRSPHIFYKVTESEHYSRSLDRHFRHQHLSIGYNYEGPTEIGGLVVHPTARKSAAKPGKQLSYVRFLFMAMAPKLFRSRVLAELLPPLLPDRRSVLWEAIGKKFTGLEYKVADELSRKNKEFIKELFPPSDICISLLDEKTQRVVGEVGPETVGVRKMLERIGFQYVRHIDPFDGGPHYEANFADISLVKAFRRAPIAPTALRGKAADLLVGIRLRRGVTRFRAIRTHAQVTANGVEISLEAREALKVRPGDLVGTIPFL